MSSFKRKSSAKAAPSLPGTRTSAASPQSLLVSTGIPSLDDVLGGGLPLSCLMLVSSPDPHSNYGELVLKYGISQGLASGHRLCVVGDEDARQIIRQSFWKSNSLAATTQTRENQDQVASEDKIKIAWRYEQMKQFRTTVTHASSSDDYCCTTFDITTQMPSSVIETASQAGLLTYVDVPYGNLSQALHQLEEVVTESSHEGTAPLRVYIPAFASPAWGDLSNKDLLSFLLSLRQLLRRYPNTCATVVIPSFHFAPGAAGSEWIQKSHWLADASVTLSAFSANPALTDSFPAYHGFLHLHKLPAPHTLLIPSDKISTLRFGEGAGEGGENNLAFKCTRKRLIFETLHLDVEGGVGERRTTPAAGTGGDMQEQSRPKIQQQSPGAAVGTVAQVDVELEDVQKNETIGSDKQKVKKPKKRVAFHSERPDVYDF